VFGASEAVLHQRTYFTPTIMAYVVGLGVAFAANSITHLGQPALLYLVPATLGAIGLTAVSRGEAERVMKFSDTTTGESLTSPREL
jgi:minor histocompatibility antigen H13